MKITINGESQEHETTTLAALLVKLGHAPESVATALNQEFIPRHQRDATTIAANDAIEIIAPMSGG